MGRASKSSCKKYLNVPNEKIECFGAAQFEIYKKLRGEDRKQLADFFEVDPTKKIILYAGVGASESETIYLNCLRMQ